MYSRIIFAVSILNVCEQWLSWLPRVCSHELLESSASLREREREMSVDVRLTI